MFLAVSVATCMAISDVAIVSFYDDNDLHKKENEGHFSTKYDVKKVNLACEQNHRAYAKYHHYDYINPRRRLRRWSKLVLNSKRVKLVVILEALATYPHVLWIDADVVFHSRVPVEEWIAKMGTKDIMMAADIGGHYLFNTGVVLFKSTPTSIRFMTDVVDEVVKLPLQGLQDQEAMQRMVMRKYHNITRIFRPRSDLQAFAKLREVHNRSWLVHLTCCNMRCGGKPIPDKFCNPYTYDFRRIMNNQRIT